MNKEEMRMVPKLRFSEFINDDAWKQTTIGEIGKFYYGKSAPKWSLAEDALTPCVRYGELYTKFDTIISRVLSFTNIDPNTLRFSKGGEILVPRVGEVPQDFAKHCCYLPFADVAIGEMISVYETQEHPIFYTHYFRTLWREFAKVVEGQNVKNLYYVNLEPIPIGKPSYAEQQKIADCLSSLDSLITAHTQKLDALKAHKKGLLQQIFPAEGEKVPRLRFAEFGDSGEWEEKKLCGEGIAYFKNKKLSVSELNIGTYVSTENLLPDYGGKTMAAKLPSSGSFTQFVKGDILVSNIRPYLKKVWQADEGGAASNDVIVISAGKKIASSFLALLVANDQFISFVMKSAEGVKMPRGDKDVIKLYSITFPSIAEQRKIALCLSSVEECITAQTEKIAQLKLHKKGLMQGLFPKTTN